MDSRRSGGICQKRKTSPVEKTIVDDTDVHSESPTPPTRNCKHNWNMAYLEWKFLKKDSKGDGLNIDMNEEIKQKDGQKDTTEYRSKEKSGKNSSLPDTWFINDVSKEVWLDDYISKPISFCSMICTNLIEVMYLEVMKKMKKSSIWKVINPGIIGYPRLTRLFYLNLKVVEGDRLAISSRVAGKDIILDHSVFAKVLGCAESYKVDNHPGRKEGVKMAKDEFFYTPHSNPLPCPDQLTRPMLDLEAMILFTILEKCVIPTSEKFLSDKMLYVMHLIMNDYEVDLPELIMEHMLSASTEHTLPYANLLPKFLKYFGVSVENEEKVTSEMEIISEMYLEDELFKDEGVEEVMTKEEAQGSDATKDEEEKKDASDEAEDTGDEEKEEVKDEEEKEDTDNEEEKEDTEEEDEDDED